MGNATIFEVTLCTWFQQIDRPIWPTYCHRSILAALLDPPILPDRFMIFLTKNFFRQIFPTLRNDRSRSRSIDRWPFPLRQTSFPTPHLRRYGPWLARRSWYLAQRRQELPRKCSRWRRHNVFTVVHNVFEWVKQALYTATKWVHVHFDGIEKG